MAKIYRKMKLNTYLLLLFSVILLACNSEKKSAEEFTLTWEEVQAVPASFGDISKGVSAAFVGILDDNLVVAGGCNFPDVPAAEGGKKIFYKDILMLDDFGWKKLGELPEAIAYGVSITYDDKLIFVGGQNDNLLSTVYVLEFEDDVLKLDTLPSLPFTFDNGAGCLHENKIVIFGGNQNGIVSSDVWSLDLGNSDSWQKESTLPIEGGLVQPILVSQSRVLSKKSKEVPGGEIYVSKSMPQLFAFGGFSPAVDGRSAQVNQAVWSFNQFALTWEKTVEGASPNEERNSFSGGVGIAVEDSLILLLGGVNQQIFEEALNRNLYLSKADENTTDTVTQKYRKEAAEYMHHPAEWYRFNDEVWLYNTNSDSWKSLGKYPQAALAGASIVADDDVIYVVNGELKPGVRTPKIWKIVLE